MSFFLHYPDTKFNGANERLALVAVDGEDMRSVRWNLICDVAESVRNETLSPIEADRIVDANVWELPVDEMIVLFDRNDWQIYDAESGLLMTTRYPDEAIDNPATAKPTLEKFITDHPLDIFDDESIQHQHGRLIVEMSKYLLSGEVLTHYGYEAERTRIDKQFNSPVNHVILGRMKGDDFIPVITLLDKSHPVFEHIPEDNLANNTAA